MFCWIRVCVAARRSDFRLSRSLEKTGREYYRQACEQLKADALSGRIAPQESLYDRSSADIPPNVEEFRESEESERFVSERRRRNRLAVSGSYSEGGERLATASRHPDAGSFR